MDNDGKMLDGNLEECLKLSRDVGNATATQGADDRYHNPITTYQSHIRSLAIKFAHEKNFKARKKILEMYANHLMNFKRSVLINRRRWQQRLHRRQLLLRSFFMQHILELETSFLELIPIPKLGGIQLRTDLPQEVTSTEAFDMPTYMHRFASEDDNQPSRSTYWN